MPSSDEWLRRILAYTILFGFLVFIFSYGVADSLFGMSMGFRPLHGLNSPGTVAIPDFSRYEFMRKLSAEEFPIDDPTRRVIITGDLHGMIKPLQNLLHYYSLPKDVFIHVGDIVTRGPHEDSMALLTYLASNNVTGVRGNNDQEVVEWRGWLNWIASLSGGKAWLDRLEKMSPNVDADNKSKLREWMEEQRKAASKDDKQWWKLIPNKWVLFSDHYKVARDMSASEFQYLLDLPLRLYVPSAHVFIVHAGLLASDPQYPYYDERQPLARLPTLMATDADTSKRNKTKNEVESLRKLQDLSLLTLIPQNLIPWVVLNIRGVKNGKVSKKNGKKGGTPWSELWNLEMNRCVGYNEELTHGAVDGDSEEISGRKKDLPCYPSTVIYGHAAARGLDLKRWSIGLDSGCVYGRKLSALVIGGTEDKPNQNGEGQLDDDDEAIENHDEEFENHGGVDSSAIKHGASFLFSDSARARIRRVKCQQP